MSEQDQTIADMIATFAVWYVYEDAKEGGYGDAGYNAWIWRTCGYGNMCDYCLAMNGTVWMIGDPNAPQIPAHIHCRCTKEPTRI